MAYYQKLFGPGYYYQKCFRLVRREKRAHELNRETPLFAAHALKFMQANYPLALAAAYRSLQMRETRDH